MPKNTSHDKTSKRLAKKFKTDYNEGKGPDIVTPNTVIEIEKRETIRDGIRQLQGFNRPVYIAGTNKDATNEALKLTKKTTIGVMDKNGNIKKRSSRRKG